MYKLYIGLKKHLIFLRNYPDTQFAQEETQWRAGSGENDEHL